MHRWTNISANTGRSDATLSYLLPKFGKVKSRDTVTLVVWRRIGLLLSVHAALECIHMIQ